MIMIRACLSYGLLGILLLTSPLDADTWPALRGLAGTGVSAEKDLPVEWSEDENIAWKIDLPGRGNSSPAVTSDRIYLTTQKEDHSLVVIAIDRRAGEIIWERTVGSGELACPGGRELWAHRHNSATPTPVADEEHVCAFFGTGLLVCLDRSGKLIWKRDLVKEYGAYNVRFGMASSPRLWENQLFVICLHKGPSYVLAIDKSTGRNLWKTPRQLPSADDGPDGYSSPVILASRKRPELLVSGSDHIDAYDLGTGKQLWVSSGLTVDSPYGRVIASPAVSEEIIVACSANPPGAPGVAIALRTGGSGDITKTHRLWKYTPYTSDSPTPVCYRGRLYMVRDDGVASILDLKSGEEKWRDRLGTGTWRSSVVAGANRVYFLGRDGECTVMEAGIDGKILARNKLDATFFSTPALSDGTIYLRGHHELYAVRSAPRPSGSD